MNLPTKLTIIRIFLIPVFIALFFIDFSYNRIIACAVFIFACLTYWLDGYLARKWKQVTDLGKFLDPIADKMLVACALIAIIPTPTSPSIYQTLITIFAMVIMCRELMVSCFRILAASKHVVLAADWWGKAKTVCQMISLIILIPFQNFLTISWLSASVCEVIFYVGFGLLALATLLTIISGTNYVVKNKQVLKNDDNK